MKHAKILIFSDSHGCARNLMRALEEHQNTYDFVFHLGDGIADLPPLQSETACVRGNYEDCFQQFRAYPQELLLNIAGKNILLCHGHQYHVKSTEAVLTQHAARKDADIVLYGHTHVPCQRYLSDDGRHKPLYVLNPGSISRPRDGRASYGVLEISTSGGVLLSHRYME